MAVLPLAKVIAGMKITAKAWNAMIDAIQDTTVGHTHTGANDLGARVSHANLVDGVINATVHTHAALAAHVGSTAGTGATGVHGLHATAAVMGAVGTQETFAKGAASLATKAGDSQSTIVTTGLTAVTGAVVTLDVDSGDGQYFNSGFTQSTWVAINTPANGQVTITSKRGGGQTVCTAYWLAWGTK